MNTCERKQELIERDPFTIEMRKQLSLALKQQAGGNEADSYAVGELIEKFQNKWNIPIFHSSGCFPLAELPIFGQSYYAGHKNVIDARETHQFFEKDGKLIKIDSENNVNGIGDEEISCNCG